MVFSSAIFLFVFFPAVFAAYHIVPGTKGKNVVLVLFGLLFYSFGKLTHLPLLLLSILVNYGAGLLLGTLEGKGRRRAAVTAAVVFNVGLIVLFKYLDFLLGTVNDLLGTAIPMAGLPLPLGISFFTFTALSYVIEVYRKPKNSNRSLLEVALYISFFPAILSGPIMGYRSAAPQLRERACTAESTARGLRRFILGMAKKLLIADILGRMVDGIYAAGALNAGLAWVAALGYGVQVFFDLGGYTDMAIGIGQVFGFVLPENFDRPFAARSMSELWKRWHMSLTGWFRNYLYMPMAMSRPLQRLYKRWAAKYGRAKANRLSILIPSTVVWLLTGLWHGAAWHFVLWGLWHGLFCILEGVGLIRTQKLEKSRWGRALLAGYVWLVYLVSTVLFRSGDMATVGRMYAAMAGMGAAGPAGVYTAQSVCTPLALAVLILGLVLCLLPASAAERLRRARWAEPAGYVLCLALLALCVMSMAQSGFQPFIYGQF